MSIAIRETAQGKVLELELSGKLTRDDYRHFVPEFDRLVKEKGTVSILFQMVDFHGMEVGAMWDDFKVGMKHYADIARLAVVGDKDWEKYLAVLCRPFTRAEVRYFDIAALEEARGWVAGSRSRE